MSRKRIVFGRHAKSSWANPGQKDFDRPLNERGQRNAPQMALRLANTGFHPDVIVTSAARRAVDTAGYFSNHFGCNLMILTSLYHAEPHAYLSALQELPERVSQVAVFGHNPTLSYIAGLLPGCSVSHVPTCGLLISGTDISDWVDIRWENLSFEQSLTPKESEDE